MTKSERVSIPKPLLFSIAIGFLLGCQAGDSPRRKGFQASSKHKGTPCFCTQRWGEGCVAGVVGCCTLCSPMHLLGWTQAEGEFLSVLRVLCMLGNVVLEQVTGLLAVGLACSLVAMTAAGLEPPNHFIHSSAGSESSQQESLGSREEGGRRGKKREREGRRRREGRREDLLGLPQRPRLSLPLYGACGLSREKSLAQAHSRTLSCWSHSCQSDPVGSAL